MDFEVFHLEQGNITFLIPDFKLSTKKMREMIEKVSYAPRLEVFARERFEGWDAIGNEVDE